MKASIERIFIASDPFFTSELEQRSNVRWLFDLLARPVKAATGIAPELLIGAASREAPLSRTLFFDCSGIEVDETEIQFYYSPNAIRQASMDYLARLMGPHTLLIGYELSEQTREIFSRCGVTYVDVWLHPIRYLDDLLFGFSSNEREVFARLTDFSLDSEHFRLYADKYRISTYKGFRRTEVSIEPNSALFVGQTLKDKATCRHTDGKMLSLLDYRTEFREIGKRYSKVYFSRHPYVKTGDEEILDFVHGCGFAEFVDYPAYRMLASENLEYVFSISSSVVYEALFFGKQADFLYRPVIDLSTTFGPRSYVSIFQEFVSGHFWSDVLSPLLTTKPSPRAVFLNEKDQLRDMLAFYWSYRHVDKLEGMRAQLNAVDHKLQRLQRSLGAGPAHGTMSGVPEQQLVRPDPREVMDRLTRPMAEVDLVSFDIFDTLLSRPLASPTDLFVLMAPAVERIVGNDWDFVSARTASRDWVEHPSLPEEVLLSERYRAIGERQGLTEAQTERLYTAELDTERRLLGRRGLGCELLREALRMQKRVVLVSDTYFDQDFVLQVLNRAAISGYEQLYCSSEVGVLKRTGRLFDHIAMDTGVSPAKILHVGDDALSDVQRAKGRGMQVLHIPRATEAVQERLRLPWRTLIRDSLTRSIVSGLCANHLADNPFVVPYPSAVGGNPESIGYCLAGPMLLGLALWLLREARSAGVERLVFLARDGDIIKQCYDIVARACAPAPESVYALASRRALRVATMHSVEDAVSLLEANFSPTSVRQVLFNRFGVSEDALAPSLLAKHGFTSGEEMVSSDRNLASLRALVKDLGPEILANASDERALLVDYYDGLGVADSTRRQAVVDVGHHGSLQISMSRLLGNMELGGFYFALLDGARELQRTDLSGRAYLGELESGEHPYTKHILMFELLFMNQQGSFVRFEREDAKVQAKMLSLHGERQRLEFCASVHSGILTFVKDAIAVIGDDPNRLRLPAEETIGAYSAMLNSPTRLDAEPFVGISFENIYSGRDARYVINPDAVNGVPSESIWVEGARAVADKKQPTAPTWALNAATVSNRLGLLSDRKLRKLQRDPESFFRDSKRPWVRGLARWVGSDDD